jgi:hypothetical protein
MILLAGCLTTLALGKSGNYRPGLAGTFFLGEEFTRPTEGLDILRSLDQHWRRRRGKDWSGRWAGFIEGPYSGEVTFTAVVTNGLWLRIGETTVIAGLYDDEARSGKIVMEKGKKVPIVLEFISWDGRAELHLYWQWPNQSRTIVPGTALSYDPQKLPDTTKEIYELTDDWLEIEVPPAQEHTCVVKHVMVYDEPGRFAGWPANGGLWSWDNEIVVAFECGWFKDRPDWMTGHARDPDKPNEDIVARSTDAGLNWTHKKYDILGGSDDLAICPGGINFGHPDFAFKSQGSRFYYAYDRCHNWRGPFRLAVVGIQGHMAARTDYLVNGSGDCHFFLAAEPTEGEQEKAFCARTTDGGKTIKLQGWMTDPNPAAFERWVMPSTVRLSGTHLVSAMRRKIKTEDSPIERLDWIDVYQSKDNGKSWRFLSKVADTAVVNSQYNGNPPSMILLRDGRLCVSYGFRAEPFVMCAKLSSDEGRNWSEPITVRTGARNWDFGYPRSLQRLDGKVVTVYYFATAENRDQFIAATIWDPALVK